MVKASGFCRNAQKGYLGIFGSWIEDTSDPNYLLMWSENCKFLDNFFLQKDFVIELNPTTKDCLILGDLRNVIITDNGVNNKVINKQIKVPPKPKGNTFILSK